MRMCDMNHCVHIDTETNKDTGVDTDTDTGKDIDTDTDTDTDTEIGTDTDIKINTDSVHWLGTIYPHTNTYTNWKIFIYTHTHTHTHPHTYTHTLENVCSRRATQKKQEKAITS